MDHDSLVQDLSGITTLAELRRQLLQKILLAAIPFGLMIVPAGIAVDLNQPVHHVPVFAIYCAAYLVMVLAALRASLPYAARAAAFLLPLYAVGAARLYFVGLTSTVSLFFFTFIVFTGVFLGGRAGVRALFLCILTFAVAASLFFSGLLHFDPSHQELAVNKAFWLAQTLPLIVAAVGALASLTMLLRRLDNQIQTSRTLVKRLQEEVQERRTTENALRESEERFRSLVEQPHDIIVRTDLDGRTTFINIAAASMLGYHPKELIGQSYSVAVAPESVPKVARSLARRLQGDLGANPLVQEILLRRKDGSTLPGELRSAPIYDTAGNIREIQGIIRDISERKRAEAERNEMEHRVQHAQKLESLGVLAGGIAHDFNNLLMAVLGYADIALDELPPLAPGRNSIKEIENAARRAAELCRQMLAYSGRGKFLVEPINLGDLVAEMLHLLKTSISKKILLNLNLEKRLPLFEGDATQIRQVLMNLITNASEAIGERSGVITISSGAMECTPDYLAAASFEEERKAGVYVYLEISDTGCGMDKDTVDRIFDPFFTTKFTGRGLGMAAVLGIVRGHKGALRIYSEVGKGSTFKVLFPACEDTGLLADTKNLTAAHDWKGQGLVLLVDDEETIRTLGRAMLERLGFSVLTATDGQEAIETYKTSARPISLVLLDLTMPRMDGEETFRELRRLDPRVRVVMSSGYTEHEIAARFAGKGLAGFLQKPYDRESLRACVQSAIVAAT